MQKAFCILAILAMTMGGCGAEWFPETVRTPTTPYDFFFSPAALTGVVPGTTATSNAVTITGIQSGSAPISVSGDASSQYSLNGGTYTKVAGTVNNNDKVTVQHTAASGVGQTVTTTLTIGDKSASFSSTTANVASFTTKKSGPANTFVTSDQINLILVSGSYTITVANGFYSLDGGISFSNTTQTLFLPNGQPVLLRNFSSATSGGVITTTLTIGGVTGTFTSTAL